MPPFAAFKLLRGGGGGGYNSLKGACIRGFYALSAAIFSATIQKIIIAAVFFAAGLSNISANAEGAASSGFDTDFSTPPTTLIIAIAVGYAENGTDSTNADIGANLDAGNACINHPDSNPDSCANVSTFTDEYFAIYGDLSIPNIGSIQTWNERGNSIADAQAAAMALCTDSTKCDCLAIARDITENAIPMTVAFSFTATDAGSTTTCDTVIEPDVCDGTTATVNEARTACECATGFPIMETGGLSCRAIESAADCPEATPDFVNGNCVLACESDETRNSAGDCEPTPPTTPTPPTLNCDAESTTGQNGNECTCKDGYTERVNPEMCRMPTTENMEMEESQNPQPQNNGSGRPKEFAYIGAGVFIVGFAASYIAGGGFPIFTYSPDFGYRITESGYAANIGGRADFRKDKWHFYYSANQQNANGNFSDFRYTSGGKYTADFWTATFSESVSGETANYNFSLSANLQNGIWKISPVYRMHSEYADNEFDTQNSLNLQSEFRYNNWQIRPSAGFQWQKFSDFANSGRFQINAIHRF